MRAKSWVKELQRQASPNIVIALSGNKADLASKRLVDFEVHVHTLCLFGFVCVCVVISGHLLLTTILLVYVKYDKSQTFEQHQHNTKISRQSFPRIIFENDGFRPTTLCVLIRCSTN